MIVTNYKWKIDNHYENRLTRNNPCISESCIEIKIKLNFYFHTSLWYLKGFMEVFKTFIKPYEEPQISVKLKN